MSAVFTITTTFDTEQEDREAFDLIAHSAVQAHGQISAEYGPYGVEADIEPAVVVEDAGAVTAAPATVDAPIVAPVVADAPVAG